MNYRDILKEILSSQEWMLESAVVTAAVRKKYGVARAGAKRQNSALGALKFGQKEGIFKKGIRKDNKVFWGLGNGKKNILILLDADDTQENIQELTLLSTANKNIEFLEKRLSEICASILLGAYGEKWQMHIPPFTLEKISKQFSDAKNNPWNPGDPKELLDCANISDFGNIIIDHENWEHFRDIFKNKYIIGGKLQELGQYRNAIKHNLKFKMAEKSLELSKKEYIFFNTAIQLFLEKFK